MDYLSGRISFRTYHSILLLPQPAPPALQPAYPYFSKLRASSGVSPGMQETMSSIFQRDPRPVHHAGITGTNTRRAISIVKTIQGIHVCDPAR